MDAQTAKLIEDVATVAKAQSTAVDSIVAAHNRYAEELDVMGNSEHATVDALKAQLRDIASGMRDNCDRIVSAIKHGTELEEKVEGPTAEEHGEDEASTTAAPASTAETEPKADEPAEGVAANASADPAPVDGG